MENIRELEEYKNDWLRAEQEFAITCFYTGCFEDVQIHKDIDQVIDIIDPFKKQSISK